jgi:hypothetical protein
LEPKGFVFPLVILTLSASVVVFERYWNLKVYLSPCDTYIISICGGHLSDVGAQRLGILHGDKIWGEREHWSIFISCDYNVDSGGRCLN